MISALELRAVADLLATATSSEGFGVRARLVGIGTVDPDGAFDLALRDLDGHNPTDALLGFCAPDDWQALGVLTGGWAGPIGEGPPSAHPDGQRTRLVVLVDRDGQRVGRIRFADGTEVDEAPEGGLLLDALHRALGLATEPPAQHPGVFLSRLWLASVVEAGRERPSTWAEVVACHPAMVVLAANGQSLGSAHLAVAARAMTDAWGWSGVHRQATKGWLHALVEPSVAAWMDEGMLARWLDASLPELDVLTELAVAACTPEAGARLRDEIGVLCDSGSSAA